MTVNTATTALRWEESESRYVVGHTALLGRWKVGSAYLDSMRPKGDPKRWAAACRLPGIKPTLGHFNSEREAKEKVERAIAVWIQGAGLGKVA